MRDVHVIGVGHTQFGRFLDKSVKSLTYETVTSALKDANIEKKDLEIAYFGNAMQGLVTMQEMIRGEVALRAMGIDSIPVVNCENACATGSTAFHLAWQSISGGLLDVALAVGAEKLVMDDTAKMFRNYDMGMDMEVIEELREKWKKEAAEFGDKGTISEAPRSFAMDMYASIARIHVEEFDTTQEDLAFVASKNHNHSVYSPFAQYKKPMSVEEIMAARPVVYPLTVPMCSPVADGGTAAVICSGEFLKRLKDARPVKVLSSILGTGSDRPEGFRRSDHISTRLSTKAYEAAGLGPEDIDVAEVHDATSLGELIQLGGLGFCGFDEAAAFSRSGATSLGGKIPVNVSGGLVSKGHPLGATGIGQIAEIVMQLRGDGRERQVEGARIGLTENGGGSVGVEEAVMTVHIFEKV